MCHLVVEAGPRLCSIQVQCLLTDLLLLNGPAQDGVYMQARDHYVAKEHAATANPGVISGCIHATPMEFGLRVILDHCLLHR